MTKETFEYTVETCDICKSRVKKEATKKEPQFGFTLNSYNISSGTWMAHDLKPEPVPENIDMCPECNESFKHWRNRRENKCDCCQDDD